MPGRPEGRPTFGDSGGRNYDQGPTEPSITVSGIVNDIVVGTVNSQQARVTVNGAAAAVVNRTYAATVPLQLGQNSIQVVGRDQTGNSATTSVTVTRQAVTAPFIKLVSGNNQSAAIGAALPAPLVVQLLNGTAPVPNATVIFKVTESDGFLRPGTGKPQLITVTTNAQGQAQAGWTLGNRAGAGNNTVEAYAGGYQGTAVFTASATAAAPTQIVVDTGNNQFGAINKPLPLPLVAIVTDSGFNRLGGVPVTFTVKQGGGSFNGAATYKANTDSDGRVLALLTLGSEPGQDNNVVEASFPGLATLAAAFTASGRIPGDPAQTSITGVVLDNSNNPIPNVTMRLFQPYQGTSNNQHVQVGEPVVTDAAGAFSIAPAPVGVFKLMADGTTATLGGQQFPTLEYDIVTVAGQENTVGMPIYLPALDPNARVCVSPSTGGVLTMASSPGFSLTIAAGSATFPGGSKTGCVSVTPVNPDKVPMAPGFGQQPRYIVTIQPVGTVFNPPAPMTIPNMDGLAPKAKTEMYSYDHDLAAFVAIGSGTVSADGSVIASDPGIGVIKAGWHCGGNPNTSGSAGTCPECQKCQGSQCVGASLSIDTLLNKKSRTTIIVPLHKDGTLVDFEAKDDINCKSLDVTWDFSAVSGGGKQKGVHVTSKFSALGDFSVPIQATCDACKKSVAASVLVSVRKLQFGGSLVKKKNLPVANTQQENYAALLWAQNGGASYYDLARYLLSGSVTENLLWAVNGSDQDTAILRAGAEPSSEEFSRFDILLKHKEYPGLVFDSLVVLVLPSDTQILFDQWYGEESKDMSWLQELPPLYAKLGSGNSDPEIDCTPDLWESPGGGSLLHPGSSYEMRSNVTTHGHGHQATYNNGGAAILAGVGAGSADKAHKSNILGSDSHYNVDVKPFIWAMHLDANPVDCDFRCLSVSGDFVRQDQFLGKYLDVRPSIANSKPALLPSECGPNP